ncbi:hypothetical protein [Curtobacterium sp. VKM Ac-2887]|uniref:hypothetical protein n=1 Tax=Curtobacterium sp. VKM Ac-2887 TaxID=2783819 RepID=UPI00188D286E|nr:hypothetical protein [Curtobacterium sp. VKM Ac-2887]MBF4587627.1 hypothetical protein [Curtobacterium sp. VKM Ac-2887]
MGLQQDSELARFVANMRTATAEHNPFTISGADELTPSSELRALLGAAIVQLFHGLASLVEHYPAARPALREAGADLDLLLQGLGDAIARAASADADAADEL